MLQIPIVVALVAGVVSFLSPCVVPLIPGYIAYLAGTSSDAKPSRRQVFLTSVSFVVGFTLVFAVLGVLLNTLLEAIAYDVLVWMSRIGGVIIMVFGLYIMGLFNIPWLERAYRFQPQARFHSRYVTAILFGAAFAAGWTPCVGAVLGGILGLAVTQPGTAFALLLAYAIGFGIPFLLIGLFLSHATGFIDRLGPYLSVIQRIFGGVLVILGVLVFTQTLSRLANFELLMKLSQ